MTTTAGAKSNWKKVARITKSLFFNSFNTSKFKTAAKLAVARIKLLRNKREVVVRQMRRDIALLLQSGQDATARIRVEHVMREQNILAANEFIELFCELIVQRLTIIAKQRECPADLKEGISSLIFAAPRCSEIPELVALRDVFEKKYGKDFVAAATDLRPSCGVNRMLIDKLSVRTPAGELKLRVLKEIAKEYQIDWDTTESETELLKPPEKLIDGPPTLVSASSMPINPPREETVQPNNPPSAESICSGLSLLAERYTCMGYQLSSSTTRYLLSTTRYLQRFNPPREETVQPNNPPSAESICSGLSQLAERYKCMGDQLSSSITRDLLSSDQDKKLVEELINVSLNLLDVCGSTWDMVTLFKEYIRDLQCALRRRKCENGIMKYKCFRKKMKKDVEMLVARLKRVDNMVTDSDNNQVAAVMQKAKGVSALTVVVFESLLLYLSTPTSKPSLWSSVVSKLIHKGKVACEDQQAHKIMNEFESIDYGLQTLCIKGSPTQEEKVQIAKCGLEKQETLLDCMETRLECIFRCLIQTRAYLLNIISQHWNSCILASKVLS